MKPITCLWGVALLASAFSLQAQSPELNAVKMQEPAIDLEKYTNDEDADNAPGPYLPVGSTVTWKYVITNISEVELKNISLEDDREGRIILPQSSLKPGESMQVTKTGTVVSGQYSNMATVSAEIGSSGENYDYELQDSDVSHYYGVSSNPAIDIQKYTNNQDADTAPGPSIEVGQTVTWKYVITNTGDVGLGSIALTDDRLGAIALPKTTLSAGESLEVTRTGTAVAGQYRNVATVTAVTTQGAAEVIVSDSDPSHYLGIQATPAINLEKYVNNIDADTPTGPYIPVGSTVTFTFVVTNTGNVALGGLQIVDDQLGNLGPFTDVMLEPGQSTTITRTTTATAGQHKNTATATANYLGTIVQDQDAGHYYGVVGTPEPAIDVEKSTNGQDADTAPGPHIPVGSTVTWRYTVTNRGNVPLLVEQLKDDQLGVLSIPYSALLNPGQSWSVTRTGTAVAGQYRNVATVTAVTTQGASEILVTDTDPSHYFGIAGTPGIDIEKSTNDLDADTAPGPYLQVGSTVTWKYVITNTGNVALGGLQVIDDQLGNLGPFIDVMFEPGQTITITRTGTVQSGQYKNIATVTATYLGTTVTDRDPSHYFGIIGQPHPSIDIEKSTNDKDADSPPGPFIPVGSTVTWKYTITNNGTVPLQVTEIKDDHLGVLSLPYDTQLDPGEVWTLTRTGTAKAGQYSNMAFVTAKELSVSNSTPISDSDPSHYYGTDGQPRYSVDIEKWTNNEDADTPPGPAIPIGQTVTWTFQVTNTGNTPIEIVNIKDDQLGVIWETSASGTIILAPGEKKVITRSGTAVAGQYKNVATVTAYSTGDSPAEVLLTDSDPSHYLGIESRPAIDIEKYTNDQDADTPPGPYLPIGSTVTWKYVITNIGNVALGGLQVVDDHLGNLGPFIDVMFEPGKSITITRTGTVVGGQYKNTATVTATYLGQTVKDQDVSHYFGVIGQPVPSVDIEKYINNLDADEAPGPSIKVGSPLTWTFTISNNGNVPLLVLEIRDDKLGVLNVPEDAVLDPGETWTLTRSGTAIAGQYRNIATVKALNISTSDLAEMVTDSDPAHYYGVSDDVQPAVDIEKTINGDDADTPPGPHLPIGETITWSYVVRNSGNTPIELSAIKDDKLGTIWESSATEKIILEAGQTRAWRRSGQATAGQYKNTATVIAHTISGPQEILLTDTDVAHYFGIEPKPAIDIEKYTNDVDADTPTGPLLQVGSTVTWKYVITNTGNVALGGLNVVDSHLGNLGPFTDVMFEPGKTITITRSGKVMPGQYRNTATVTATYLGQTVTDTDPSHYYGIDGEPRPLIDIEKSTNGQDADNAPGPIILVGSPVEWQYIITNTGNIPLRVENINDNRLGSLAVPEDAILDPGESWTLKRTGTAVLGQYENKATVIAYNLIGTSEQVVTDSDFSHYLGIGANPSIDIEKYTNEQDADLPPGPTIPVGSAVTWKYRITNSGNVALSILEVIDDVEGRLPLTTNKLEPGQTMTLQKTGIAKPGQYRNTATIRAVTTQSPAEVIVSDSDPSHYFGSQGDIRHQIDLEKNINGEDADEPTGPLIAAGETITWTFIVTNTGNTPVELTLVKDDQLGVIWQPSKPGEIILQPGENRSYSRSGIAELGQHKNVATATASPIDATADILLTDTDASHYFGFEATPSIDVEKYTNDIDADVAPGPLVPIGSTITWKYVIKNTGNVALGGLQVIDDQIGNLGPFIDVMFPPGKEITITRTGIARAGQYKNVATATAVYLGRKVQDQDPSHYFGIDGQPHPSIDIEKFTNEQDADLPPGPSLPVGSPVSWKYVVKNNGNVPIRLTQVKDDKLGLIYEGNTITSAILMPGETRTFTRSGTVVAGQYSNNATASAEVIIGTADQLLTDSDKSHYFGIEPKPSIDIEKFTNNEDADEAPGPMIPVGQTVTWKYVVKNTGNVALASVTVRDDKLGLIGVHVDVLFEPGQSFTLTKTGIAEPGLYKNVGTVTATYNGMPVSDSDPSHYYGTQGGIQPSIDIEKHTNGEDADSAPGPTIPVGETVTWTYIITNNGNVPLDLIKVNDDQEGDLPTLTKRLNPGESMTLTKSGKAKEGQYENKVIVQARNPNDPTKTIYEDSDLSHYFGVVANPAIDIEKYTNGVDADLPTGPAIPIGQTVTWLYVIKNIGNVPLGGLNVVDDKLGSLGPFIDVMFEPGKTITITRTGIAVAGQYRNNAVATATYLGKTVKDEDASHYYGIDHFSQPSIDIEKYTNNEDADAPPGPYIPVGQPVTWKYVITNTGNVPLSIVEVIDSKLGSIPLTIDALLLPGQSRTLSKNGTAKAGQYENEAIVKARVEGAETSEPITDRDKSHYFGFEGSAQPAIDIEKYTNDEDADVPPGPNISVGQTVKWTFMVKNIGNVPLRDLTIIDDQLGVIYESPSLTDALGVGETKIFTRTGTAVAGQYANTAKATAKYGTVMVEDADKSHYFGEMQGGIPAIDIEKFTNNEDADTPPGPSILVGQPVTWKYVVKNIGSVPLTNLVVTDDQLGVINPPLDVVLEPGKTVTFTKTGIATVGQYKNIVVATAEYNGTIVQDSDPSHYLGVEQAKPAIDIEKYTNNEDADFPTGPVIPIGSPVTWKYIIKNSGNVTLSDISLSDDKLGVIPLPATSLPAGETWTVTKTGTAVAGQYRNIARISAKYNAQTVTDEDPSHYLGIAPPKPAIDIEKSTNGQDADTPPGPKLAVGSNVTWLYKVKNTGNVPLKELVVTDDQLGIIYLSYFDQSDVLEVGEERVFTRTGFATAGQYRNVAKATAKYENQTVADEDPSHYFGGEAEQPSIDIEKSTNDQDADVPPGPSILIGQPVKWQYTVKNTGNVPLYHLKVMDDKLGAIAVPFDAVLQPGESITLTKTGKAVAGQYVNIATATADYNGKEAKDTDPSHYFGSDQARPAIDLEKYTNGDDADVPPGPNLEVGATVTWKYVLTNTGNVTLNALSLTDDQLGVIPLPTTSIAPGQTITVTQTGVAEQGQYANIAKVTAQYGDTTLSDSDPSHYLGLDAEDVQASIDVEKFVNDQDADTPPGLVLPIGAAITWKYVITNNGAVPLSQITLTDDREGFIPLPANTLAVGQSMTVTKTGTVQSGQYANLALATGQYESITVEDKDPAYYFGEQSRGPQIDVEKSTNGEDADNAPGPYIMVGNRVTWKYVISNTGSVTLTDLNLMDDKEGKIFLPQTTLESGKSLTVYRSSTATIGQYQNIATVTAKAGQSQISDSDASHYYGTTDAMPAIDVEKFTEGQDADLPPGPSIYVGKPVTWEYLIKNSGNVALTNVTLTDDVIGGIVLPLTSLAPGQSISIRKQGIATLGQYRNVAHVKGYYNDQAVEDSDVSHYLGDLGQAGGKVFEDLNRNKHLDADEPLLGGWSIQLFNESTQQRFTVTTVDQNTSSFGKWFFPPEVPAGIYTVSVELPDQWQLSYPNTSGGRYRIQYTGFAQYTLLSEEPPDFIDLTFGVAKMQYGTILGYVFYDSNSDGKRSTNEVGLRDIVVELYQNGQLTAKSITDDKGLYQFTHLLPGAYIINVDESSLPAQYVLTSRNEPHFVDLGLDQFYSGADFGYIKSLKDWGMGDRWLLARYQSWYGDAGNSQSLRHWDPKNLGGYAHTSLIGLYDSNNPNVLEYHILSAWAAGIDGFVVDWFGKDTYENQALLTLLAKAQQLTTQFARFGFNFEIAAMYRQQPTFTAKHQSLRNEATDLSYLGDYLMKHPAYWGTRRGVSNPVYVLYEMEPGLTPTQFRAQANLPPTASIVWNGFLQNILGSVDAYIPSLEKLVKYLKPDGSEWGDSYLDSTYYAMNFATQPGDIHFAVGQVWAGYDDRAYVFGNQKWMDRLNSQVFDLTWEKVHNYNYPLYMPWVMVDSWNGWNHGTEIEPSLEDGFTYLKKTRDHVRRFKVDPIMAAKGMDNLGLLVPLHIYQARILRQSSANLATAADMMDVAMQSFFHGEHLLAISIADLTAGIAPKPLHILEVGDTHIKVGWERSPNATGYRLYYSTHPEDFAPLSENKPYCIDVGTMQEYTIDHLTPHSDIYVAVTAHTNKLGGRDSESWYENLLTGAEIMKIKLSTTASPTPEKLVFVQGLPLAGETLQIGRPWITDIYGIIPDFQSPMLSQIPGEMPIDPYWTIFRFSDYGMHSFTSVMLQLSMCSGSSEFAPMTYFEVLISNQSVRPNDFISIGFFECAVDDRQHWYDLNENVSAQFIMLKMNPMTFSPNLYQIDQFSVLTERGTTDISCDKVKLPTTFKLEQNYPNPFNSMTRINYQLPEPAQVTLKIYNITGQLVETLVDKQQPAGYYSIPWCHRNKASGLYFYQLRAGNYQAVKRMVLVN